MNNVSQGFQYQKTPANYKSFFCSPGNFFLNLFLVNSRNFLKKGIYEVKQEMVHSVQYPVFRPWDSQQ